jgi:hypothetical protein
VDSPNNPRNARIGPGIVWALLVAPLVAAAIFWLLLFGEGPTRSGSPVAEMVTSWLVAPVMTVWACARFSVPTRFRPGLVGGSTFLALVFGLLIYIGIELFFGSST